MNKIIDVKQPLNEEKNVCTKKTSLEETKHLAGISSRISNSSETSIFASTATVKKMPIRSTFCPVAGCDSSGHLSGYPDSMHSSHEDCPIFNSWATF